METEMNTEQSSCFMAW